MATGLAYASFVYAIPMGMSPVASSLTSRHTPRRVPASQFTYKQVTDPFPVSHATTGRGHVSSIIDIVYPTAEEVSDMFNGNRGHAYRCPEKHNQHKAAIIRILEAAATALHIVGEPVYNFQNPRECVCRRTTGYDVVFYFGVDVAGGGDCRHGDEGMCQGMTKSSLRGQVEGEIIAPPHGDVVFER